MVLVSVHACIHRCVCSQVYIKTACLVISYVFFFFYIYLSLSLCFYCCHQLSAEGTKMRKPNFHQVLGLKLSWKENGNAERIFNLLPEKDTQSYSALIRGMVKV